MKRFYLSVVFLLVSVFITNIVTLYSIVDRPSTAKVQEMIEQSIDPRAQALREELSAELQPAEPIKGDDGVSVTGPRGPKGETPTPIVGPPGPAGPAGKDGQSIVGPPGEKGAPGRELELRQDPATGEIYSRYTGDTAWTLVEPITSN